MMKVSLAFLSLIIMISCNDSVNVPTPVEEDDPLVVGELDDESARYFDLNQSINVSLNGSVDYGVDIDEDGTDELLVSIAASSADSEQLIKIQPINAISLGAVEFGQFLGEETSMVLVKEEGSAVIPSEIDWSTGEMLFGYSNRNQFIAPYAIHSMDIAYMPVLIDEKEGWVSCQIEAGDSGLGFSKIHFYIYAQKAD